MGNEKDTTMERGKAPDFVIFIALHELFKRFGDFETSIDIFEFFEKFGEFLGVPLCFDEVLERVFMVGRVVVGWIWHTR